MIGAGLDFGTSNSTAALFDGERLTYVDLEDGSPILPTAIHLDRGYAATTGQAAIDRYVEENRGRRVELVAEVIGEASSHLGSGDLADETKHYVPRLYAMTVITRRRETFGFASAKSDGF